MHIPSLIHVPPYQICFSDTPCVFHFELKNGILICSFNESLKKGGAVLLTGYQENDLKYVEELFKVLIAKGGTSRDLTFKVIGPSPHLNIFINKISLISKQSAIKPCINDSGELHAYFFSDSGRVRIGEQSSSPAPVIHISKSIYSKKRVLIIDDSKTIRTLLTKILEKDFEVVGCAESPSKAEEMIEKLTPDVITLDIHMPEMDGVELLKKYLPKYPIPTIMISSISMEESDHVFRALEAGAVDYIKKPSLDDLDIVAPLIIEKVKTTASVQLKKTLALHSRLECAPIHPSGQLNQSIIVGIGSSTGGTEALRKLLTQLPKEIPPIVIVQHIPPVFSKAFANRLNEVCQFSVKEAERGDELKPGQVFIAPGGYQMSVVKHPKGHYHLNIEDTPPVNRHKPSVDVLFNSLAEVVGKKAIGIILTGMGNDGAKGLLKMRQAGAKTIAQDESTSVVFGMPQAAIQLKAAEQVRALDKIPNHLLSLLSISNINPLKVRY